MSTAAELVERYARLMALEWFAETGESGEAGISNYPGQTLERRAWWLDQAADEVEGIRRMVQEMRACGLAPLDKSDDSILGEILFGSETA